ncbi:MAG: hypothetical protein JNK81_04585 [Anaerolineales bacterium]|nr:hypothetical protein [Anaerolineales bacterium]
MRNFLLFQLALCFAVLAVLRFAQPAQASHPLQSDDPISRGEYLATISGCTSCHTPDTAEYQNPQTMTIEQVQTIAFDGQLAMDTSKLLAGGRAFPLGPAGVVYTRNITMDEETGIGLWTDEQIKLAIKSGVRPDGTVLFPVMPYHVYNGMADKDLEDIIAYMKSLPPVRNEVPERTVSTEGMPVLPYQDGITAPDPADPSSRGAYLVNHIMGCMDCHTPIDPATGAPIMEKHLAGRQPYEGPWGIVYGGNITPHDETGIGTWTDEEVKRALLAGIGKDGRRLILMPWYAYSALTPEDTEAVVYYLKNDLPAVDNQIPAASLNPDFMVVLPAQTSPLPSQLRLTSPWILVAVAIFIVGIVSASFWLFNKNRNG